MRFSLTSFLEDLLAIGPALVSGIMGLKNEVPNVSKVQLASDSLHLATGISAALTHADPAMQAEAQAASSIAQTFVNAVAQASGQTVS